MPLPKQLQLALDTNVLFDRAANQDFAITILDFLNAHGSRLIVTYTVLAELDSAITKPLSRKKDLLAKGVLENLVLWCIKPVVIEGADLAIAAEFSNALRRDGLIPFEEFHDGCILAEAALAGAQFLVTSDIHLLAMDREKTKHLFAARSLPEVHVASPRSLYVRLRTERRMDDVEWTKKHSKLDML